MHAWVFGDPLVFGLFPKEMLATPASMQVMLYGQTVRGPLSSKCVAVFALLALGLCSHSRWPGPLNWFFWANRARRFASFGLVRLVRVGPFGLPRSPGSLPALLR